MILDLCLSFIGTVFFPVFIGDNGLLFSYSHLSLLFMMCCYGLLAYAKKQKIDRRLRVYTRILGLLLSLMTTCGYYLETIGMVPYSNIKWICAAVIYAELFGCILQVTWLNLEKLEKKLAQIRNEEVSFWGRTSRMIISRPILLVMLFLICWTPCYLSCFPGFFFYDATSEYLQSVKGYSAAFPMIHSVLIIGVLKLSHLLTGAYNAGIAAYVIVQMVLLASLFAHILHKFWKNGKNAVLLGILAGYFALFPLIHVLVTTSVRDILFSGMITYLVFQVYELVSDPVAFFESGSKPILLGFTLTLTIFARSNFVGVIPFICICGAALILWLFCRRKIGKGLTGFCLSFAGSYIVLGCALMVLCFPLRESGINNSLSIFTQPIARAYFYEQENWTEEQKQRFTEYFDMDRTKYVAENADHTKSSCRVDKNTLLPFLRFWGSMCIRYPSHYVDGILANTLQMWFPGSPADAYVESGDWEIEKSFFFVLDEIEEPGVHKLWFPGIRSFYSNLGMCISYEKIPVVSMLFSIGFQFWFLINAVFYVNYRKMYYASTPLLILTVYALITAFSPLVYLRYYAALFMGFPITLVLTVQPGHNSDI